MPGKRPVAQGLLVGKIEIEEHEDSGLGINAQQSNDAEPDRNTHVVAQGIHDPDRPHCRKGHGQDDDHGLHRRSSIAVKQEENKRYSNGDDEEQSLADALRRFELATPGDRIARRKLQALQLAFSLLHIVTQWPFADVDKDITSQQSILVTNHRRAIQRVNGRQLCQGNLLIATGGDKDFSERLEI